MALAALLLIFGTFAFAAEPSSCVHRVDAFDGSVPLTYATVSGGTGARLYLYSQYPPDCGVDVAGPCKRRGYLVPGDIVAISVSCASWAYVQYLSDTGVTIGWVDARQLATIPPPPSDGAEQDSRNYQFTMTKGLRRPVCEAYLQRLNQTRFVFRPSCGRPEFDGVPGFTHLRRLWLTTAEVNRVYNDLLNFRNDLSSPIPDQRMTNADGTVAMVPPPGDFPADVRFDTWRVEGGFDVENDGHPEDVVMWSNGSRGGGTCGIDSAHTASYYGLILSPSGYRVDRQRTIEVFEREHVSRLDGHSPVGVSMGLFQYRGKTYFDTFLDQPQNAAERRQADRLAHTLAVFAREDHKTVRVCEYVVSDQEGD
jgi:hypothetical protein